MQRRDVADRNLLFGLLALQNGLINQSVLVGAFHAWTLDKNRSIADVLLSRGAIDTDERALLEGLAERHLKRHGGDAEKSLAVLGVGTSTRDGLAKLADPDLTDSLATVAPSVPTEDDPLRTESHFIGTSTSEGRRFRVLRPHAKGGLGAVFVALDGELNREVALKEILDHHADDPRSRARFVVEAEITGGLEHPGIVPVYGLGHYDDGRPYYAMRFIRGDSLKEAIAAYHDDPTFKSDPGRRSLALRKLLRRFVDVCNAIDYAHGRGILHRDLKPGNVIVGKHGETLVVDWGLAKPMGRSEEGGSPDERTLMPSSSGSSETLPGQAIGTPAFMSPEQAVGDLDNLGPRSDVYSLGATLFCLLTGRPPFLNSDIGAVLRAVGKGEFSHPRQLDPSIERPLEAVCLKAMAVRPDDRYETARSLADDVERWIADEPVTAYCEPRSVRLARWSRRNRTKVAALGLSMATAVVLLATLSILVGAANHRTTLALGRVRQEQARTAEALERADTNFRRARQAVDDYFTTISEDVLLDEPGMQPLREKLLRSALKYHEEFLQERDDDPAVEAELALSHRRFSAIVNLTGRNDEALAHIQEAVNQYQALTSREPGQFEYRRQLALSFYELGAFFSNQGRREEAIRTLREAIDLDEQLLRDRPGDESVVSNLSRALASIGQALAKQRSGREEAERCFRRSQDLLRKLVAEHPETTRYRIQLADIQGLLHGIFVGDASRQAELLASSREAIDLYEGLIARYPNSPRFRDRLATVYDMRGVYHYRRKEIDEAVAEFQQSRRIMSELIRANPQVEKYQLSLTKVCLRLGNLLNMAKCYQESIVILSEAGAILNRLIPKDPKNPDMQVDSAQVFNSLSVALGSLGRYEEAADASREAIVHFREQVKFDPENVFIKGELMICQYNLATTLSNLDHHQEAIVAFENSKQLGKEIFGGDGWSHLEGEAIGGEIHLAYALREVGRVDEAEKSMTRVRPRVEGNPGFLFSLAGYDARGANLLAKAGRDPSEVEGLKLRALETLGLAVRAGFSDREELRKFGEKFLVGDRPEFGKVMMDAGFPTDPFAFEK